MQTARMSAIESVTNTVLSFVIAWLAYWLLIPLIFKIRIDQKQSAGIILVFNILSLGRQFVLRRIFNRLEKNNEKQVGAKYV